MKAIIWISSTYSNGIKVLSGIPFRRQYRGFRWWWVLTVLSQILFASVIFFAFSGLFPRLGHQGGALTYGVSVYAGIVVWAAFQDSFLQGLFLFDEYRGYLLRFRVPLWVYGVASSLPRVLTFSLGIAVLLLVRLALIDGPVLKVFFGVALMPVVVALGVGVTWLSSVMAALTPQFRSFMPQVFLLWFFGTPIVYPRSVLPEPISVLAAMNPMTYVVEIFQWLWLPSMEISALHWAITVGWSGAVFFAGYFLTLRFRDRIMDTL